MHLHFQDACLVRDGLRPLYEIASRCSFYVGADAMLFQCLNPEKTLAEECLVPASAYKISRLHSLVPVSCNPNTAVEDNNQSAKGPLANRLQVNPVNTTQINYVNQVKHVHQVNHVNGKFDLTKVYKALKSSCQKGDSLILQTVPHPRQKYLLLQWILRREPHVAQPECTVLPGTSPVLMGRHLNIPTTEDQAQGENHTQPPPRTKLKRQSRRVGEKQAGRVADKKIKSARSTRRQEQEGAVDPSHQNAPPGNQRGKGLKDQRRKTKTPEVAFVNGDLLLASDRLGSRVRLIRFPRSQACNLDSTAILSLPSAELQSACGELSIVGTTLQVTVTGPSVTAAPLPFSENATVAPPLANIKDQSRSVREPNIKDQSRSVREPNIKDQSRSVREPNIKDQSRSVREPSFCLATIGLTGTLKYVYKNANGELRPRHFLRPLLHSSGSSVSNAAFLSPNPQQTERRAATDPVMGAPTERPFAAICSVALPVPSNVSGPIGNETRTVPTLPVMVPRSDPRRQKKGTAVYIPPCLTSPGCANTFQEYYSLQLLQFCMQILSACKHSTVYVAAGLPLLLEAENAAGVRYFVHIMPSEARLHSFPNQVPRLNLANLCESRIETGLDGKEHITEVIVVGKTIQHPTTESTKPAVCNPHAWANGTWQPQPQTRPLHATSPEDQTMPRQPHPNFPAPSFPPPPSSVSTLQRPSSPASLASPTLPPPTEAAHYGHAFGVDLSQFTTDIFRPKQRTSSKAGAAGILNATKPLFCPLSAKKLPKSKLPKRKRGA